MISIGYNGFGLCEGKGLEELNFKLSTNDNNDTKRNCNTYL